MAEYSISADRARFFSALRSAQSTPALVEEYMKYDGILYDDQINFMKQLFGEVWTREGRVTDPTDLLAANGDVSPDFLAAEFPKLLELHFQEMEPANMEWTEILPATPNQYQDPLAPIPPSLRLRRPTRSAFGVCKITADNSSLFVFPHGYQLFRKDNSESLRDARSRSFSKSILPYPRIALDGAVVVIQDTHDGGNFCHFLYDWLPRVIYFLKTGLESLSNVVFVMGGIAGPFHKLLISIVMKQHGIPSDRFIFPDDRMIFDISGPIYIFSDQIRDPIHPAHMAHPQTIQMLRELIAETTQDKGEHRRLFISRGDAMLRRITNEEEIIAGLKPLGFTAVRLAEHDIHTQIALLRGAEIVIGGHGMGFTNILAHDGGLKIIELFHPRIGSDAYIFIAKARGFQHRCIFGKDANDNEAGYAIEPGSVDEQLSSLEACPA